MRAITCVINSVVLLDCKSIVPESSGVTRGVRVGENFGRKKERQKKGGRGEKEEEREKRGKEKRENGEERKRNSNRGGQKLKMEEMAGGRDKV